LDQKCVVDSRLEYGTAMTKQKISPIPSAGRPPATDSAASRGEIGARQEWLLDEALKETFPASDPISPARPAEREDESRTSRSRAADIESAKEALSTAT
jgi:hypothetical protein